MPLHAFTHVQLALSERNREPVLTFFLQRFPTYSASTLQLRCFHNQRFLLPTSCFLFLPPSSPPSSNSNPPASRRPPASKDSYPSSLTLLLHLQQAATLIRTPVGRRCRKGSPMLCSPCPHPVTTIPIRVWTASCARLLPDPRHFACHRRVISGVASLQAGDRAMQSLERVG